MRRAIGLVLCVLAWVSLAQSQTTIYWKKDHVYAGPGGGEIAIITPPPSDTTEPGTPTGVGTSSVTATSVVVSWTGSTDSGGSGLAGYKVYRQKGSGASLPVGTVASGATTFTDQPLEPSTSYTWTVRAFDNAQNHSSASSGSTTSTSSSSGDTTAPSAPLQLTGRVLGSSSVQLNWLAATDAGGSGLGGYRVKRGGSDVSGWLSATTLAYNDTTAPQNTTSTYTVEAKDGNSNVSSASNSVNVTTPMESIAPTTPGSPSASALSSTSIRISWTASTDSGGSGLAGYKVYRSAIYLISGSNPITATSFDDTGLASSNNYSYTVKAFDGVGNVSAATSAVNATTSADTIAPTTPGSFSMNWTDPWAAFTWTASTDSGGSGFAGYKIYFVGNDGAEFEMLISGSNPLTDTSWGIDTTGWEWEYFVGFRIYAVDGENNLSTPANWTPQ